MNKSVGEIAGLVGGTVFGDPEVRITGINGIQQAGPGELTFVSNRKYAPFLDTTQASAVFVLPGLRSPRMPVIEVKNPYIAFVQMIQECAAEAKPCHPIGVHPTAVIGRNVLLGKDIALDAHVRVSDDCVLGDGVIAYSGVYIGAGSVIGADTVIYPNVTIREGVSIGARCVLHAGAAIGCDGFGFAPLGGKWFKIPQVGNVVIGDDVEIGANTAVDRATFGSTVIGRGTKIDNLVQIGHNVRIGEDCVISGMSGIAGSTTIGNHVTVAAQVGVADHMEIGDNATIAGRSGVMSAIPAGQTVSGFPATDHAKAMRIVAATQRLPELPRRVRELERRLDAIEERVEREQP